MVEKRRNGGRISTIVRIGGVVALTAAALTPFAGTAGAAPGDELLPDLRTLRPSDLTTEHQPKLHRFRLRFTNTVGNHGVGPIEIDADQDVVDCNDDGDVNDHLAFQRIYLDGIGASANGYYDAGDTGHTDTEPGSAGCKYYHPAHHHWHLTDFARYTLIRKKTGKVVRSHGKVSFCLLDTLRPYPDLPGSPATKRYSPDCSELDAQGISIGWADSYASYLPGQWIGLSGLPRGRYCLKSRVDPRDHLEELDDSNNANGRPFFLHPRKHTVETFARSCGT